MRKDTLIAATLPLADSVLLDGVLAAMAEGVVIQSHDGRVVDCNPAAEQILGLSRAQLQGLSSMDPRWQAVHEDGQPFPGEAHPAMVCMRSGLAVRQQVMGIDVPGLGRRWISINASPLGSEAGAAPTGVVCTFVDITAQRALEANLKQTADALADLYDHAPCGYHSLDAEGVFVRINATELEWLGCERDEVIGKLRLSDFFNDEGRQLFAESFQRFLAQGQISGLEYELLGRHGVKRQIQISATTVRDAEGRFVMSRGVAYDVTEARQAESQALAMMREHAAMLDNNLIGIVKLKGRETAWVNKAMCRIFGYADAELVGRSSQVLYPDEAAFLDLAAAGRDTLLRGDTFRAQVAMVHKDGRPLWIDISGVRLPEARESMWMLADITALQEKQREVEHLAFHDPLTGLPNRLLLADRLDRSLVLAAREGGKVAVCFLDLDRFKPVNDLYGHAAGDALLKGVAERLRGCVRAHDTLARLGGDEFVLVLTHLHEQTDFVPILDRVISEMRRPFSLEAAVVAEVSASIGVAVFPDDAGDRAKLLRRADEALYDAKARGRNQLVRYGR